MHGGVTGQCAVSGKAPCIIKLQPGPGWCRSRTDHRYIKIDQAAVLGAAALAPVNTMSIVTGTTARALVHDVPPMKRKTLVIQNTVAAVATIAKSVGVRAFGPKIVGFVVADQQRLKD